MMSQAFAGNTVVLLHGLARSSRSMSKMETALQAAGFSPCNIGYPSTKHPIETLTAEFVVPQIRKCSIGGGPISFVTHSMGGILVRQIHRTEPGIQFGRVVMLGPPNHGSELVDHMRGWSLFQWVNGPAGQQLGTEPGSFPNSLGGAHFEVGIIAGNKPFLEPFTSFIGGPSDGKVSLESAKLEGMKDYLTLPVTHALMMRHRQVIEQTIRFLDSGYFVGAAGPNHSLQARRP
jgi:pimeloyl-ACP methyl ester carboxylesterase